MLVYLNSSKFTFTIKVDILNIKYSELTLKFTFELKLSLKLGVRLITTLIIAKWELSHY